MRSTKWYWIDVQSGMQQKINLITKIFTDRQNKTGCPDDWRNQPMTSPLCWMPSLNTFLHWYNYPELLKCWLLRWIIHRMVGRIAVEEFTEVLKEKYEVSLVKDGKIVKSKIKELDTFTGLGRTKTESVESNLIFVLLSGYWWIRNWRYHCGCCQSLNH